MSNYFIKECKFYFPFFRDNGIQNNIIIEEKTSKDGNISINRYNRGKPLGKGGFAKCYEITN